MKTWATGLASISVLTILLTVPGLAKDKDQPTGTTNGQEAVEIMDPADKVTGFQTTNASDYDLENILYAAYRAARDSALVNDNYFIYGDVDSDDIRLMIIRDLVQTGYTGVRIAYDEAEDFSDAKQCADSDATELRLHYTDDGIGMSLVAVNGARYSSYEYDPSVASDLQITHPEDCLTAAIDKASVKDRERQQAQ